MCVMQKKGKVTLFWRQKLAAYKQSKASLEWKVSNLVTEQPPFR